MMIDTKTLNEIRTKNEIVGLIRSYFPLRESGSEFAAPCPFHGETTPSFFINPKVQIFHCFGCHAGGDVFAFVMAYEQIGFDQAVRKLAERAGIKLPE